MLWIKWEKKETTIVVSALFPGTCHIVNMKDNEVNLMKW